MRERSLSLAAAALLLLTLSMGCGPDAQPEEEEAPVEFEGRAELRQTLDNIGIEPLTMPTPSKEKVALGQALFFDPIMSGSRDAACSTCHRPDQATVDNLSLPAGTAARVDPETGARMPGPDLDFVPRNVPDLFNRGHEQTRTMFWDLRLEVAEYEGKTRFRLADTSDSYDPDNFIRLLPEELDNILAAQNMLPVLNRLELRGSAGSMDSIDPTKRNELGSVHDGDLEGVWRALMKRLMGVEGYRELFARAYPDLSLESLTFAHAANGLSAFIISSFTFLDSPWDRFVAGDDDALSEAQVRGAQLFFGKAQCVACHSGELFSDQKFHNIGVRPLGRSPDPTELVDRGVAHRSVAGPEASYAFRTPPLRNVALTAPYMHNGTYRSLEAVIRHKMNIQRSLLVYDASQLRKEFQPYVHYDPMRLAMVGRTLDDTLALGDGLELTNLEIEQLVSFLESLTSPSATNLAGVVPESVPSGLEIPNPPPPREPTP